MVEFVLLSVGTFVVEYDSFDTADRQAGSTIELRLGSLAWACGVPSLPYVLSSGQMAGLVGFRVRYVRRQRSAYL